VLVTGLNANLQHKSGGSRKPKPPRFSEIGEVRFQDGVVKFPTFPSDPDPFTITFRTLTFRDMSQSRAGSFAADFTINEPQGSVRVSGQIGPWNWKDIGRTQMTGFFALPHADLGSFGGIQGSLNAGGRFAGPLSRVVCSGSVEVPDFRISRSIHAVNLSTNFRASVNGLTGDTSLESAESHFNQTVIETQGVIRTDGQHPGKTAFLRLSIEEGQVGDVLLLFTRAPQESMDGTVDLRMNVEVPPGPPGFLRKLKLDGDFGIDRGRFTKAKAQVPINHLSASAAHSEHGQNGAAHSGKNEREESRKTVLSDVAGHMSAHGGTATLTHLTFAVPGAHGALSGTYSLLNQAVNLEGHLLTTGEVSSTSSGLKAVMLKILTPFMKKNSVTDLPFTIKGTAQHPVFALDLLHKHRS
jgi:hypothetical protein